MFLTSWREQYISDLMEREREGEREREREERDRAH